MPIEQIVMYIVGGVFILLGITKFGFNGRKAQRLIHLIGEGGAQIFYVVLGIVLIVFNYLIG